MQLSSAAAGRRLRLGRPSPDVVVPCSEETVGHGTHTKA
jgi:hypothetical protein